ncbi:MAG: OmpA family protein [Pseudonocardia sp.]
MIQATEQGGGEQGVTLLRVDGRPSIGCVLTYDNTAGNDSAREIARTAFKTTVQQRISELTAQQPETNPLEALSVAAASAGPDGTVILMDSGLQTVAPLDFREPGLLTTDADRIVAALDHVGMLPDLHGRKVILAGVGYTAAPQTALSNSQRTHLIELWQRIATAAGAESVRPSTTPSTTPPMDGLPSVSTVTIPEPGILDLGCNTESILSDDGPVGFQPGSTDFVNGAAARQVLAEFADWLVQNPDARADVTGSIAHYGDNSPNGLSQNRAERVREILVDLGADPRVVTAEGAGWGPFPTGSAPPNPEVDPLNRRVVIELSCG